MDPREGFVAEAQFLTIAAVKEWLFKRVPRYQPPPEHRVLLEAPEPEIPLEVRAAQCAKLKEITDGMRERMRAEHRARYGIKDVPPRGGPVSVSEAALKALDNLRRLNGLSADSEGDAK